jgi:two-component system chemotaxis sensor kinase CheA
VTEHGERALGELEELRSAASELRLLRADVLLAELERAARDAARALDRKIEFLQGGAEIRIDAYVLSRLRGALRHVVRNAVAHGIEPEAERIALGKPPAGLVRVTIERRGHRIAVTCRDDGRGLQSDDVRRIARQRGLLADDSAAELDPGRLARILLGGGVSTARSLTEVAGRGVGLDVVRATVEELGGEVGIETDAGAGTRVEIVVPFSLSSMPALRVQADGRTSFIALDSVQKTRRLRAGDIVRSEGRQRLVDGDVVTPFLPLARALGGSSSDEPRALQTAVVVEAGGRRAAVGVDRVFGVQHVVVRSVPDHVRAHPIVAGAALDPDGLVELVVAPAALVQMAEQDRPSSEAAVRPARPPLLVIDDSLTTRMLEQSILESAGYRVDLAVSGEEGLKKAKQRRYGLFIVDVEMPGMSGFEFIERTRGDAELRQVPALLVTSRASQDDKRRGKEAGARGYIVKSEFDQGQFLDAIQRLVG